MRKLSILFALLSVLTVQCSGYYDHAKWHCGINKLTETISEWLAKPFDYHGVNQCCQAHDDHYYHHTLSREDADRVFCDCLEENANWFVRNLIEPIFCKSVQTYAIWQKFTNQNSWSSQFTIKPPTTTTTTESPLNYYLELLHQREREFELRKEQEARRREELERENERFRQEWNFFQQSKRQQSKFEWNY
ncbi:Phospholipase A2 [Caenorhabditis elegans]|uniref:Phospholipase A2 n=1 Tax=Caenorhabditis elegans TaxID=6239 RepID=Q23168_CAEEL|nr:Phospholipase A2 [Caenorhabditis elegans]CAA92029.2 Phospholipase A2 [Caenorhabditis elegans]|eukprot:NP_509856.2 Uncharacterized protein CELE_W04G3.7 [Caenorhabditis elegans]